MKYVYVGAEKVSDLFDMFLDEDMYAQSIDRDCVNEHGFVKLTSLEEVKECKSIRNIWVLTK